MKKLKIFITVTFITLTLFGMPKALTLASTPDVYTGLVKCSGIVQNPGEVECNFQTFVGEIATGINWLFYISIPFAVALFSYAGLLYMSGKQGNGNKDKAKDIFKNVAIGFVIMLISYTCIETLISWVVDPSFGVGALLGS